MKKTLLLIFIFAFSFLLVGCKEQSREYDAFAMCLTEKGVKMYGTEWCSHCKDQKELFGASFDKVDYVDCDTSKEACQKAGITGYPTWIINTETILSGTQPLEDLAKKTDCSLSKDK